jgi:hypothetical protein
MVIAIDTDFVVAVEIIDHLFHKPAKLRCVFKSLYKRACTGL